MSSTNMDMDMPFAEFAEKHLKTDKGGNSALIDLLAAIEQEKDCVKSNLNLPEHDEYAKGFYNGRFSAFVDIMKLIKEDS